MRTFGVLVIGMLSMVLIGGGLLITPAFGQAPQVGDTVVLVERDLHIPAHPGPGITNVSLRFTSGSTAEILAIDEARGWLQIRGERVEGNVATGWITRTYVASIGSQTPVPPPAAELSWCLPPGSPTPRPGRLRIATWNLANLHAEDGQSIFTGPDPSERRFALDYARIRCYIRLFDPDILAVQEVDGVEALRRVADEAIYEVHVSSRAQPAGLNGRQNTGFAFKRGLTVQPLPDVETLDVSGGALRYGAWIDATVGSHTLRLLSVHLKSGCFSNSSSGSACDTLFAQLPHLQQWIATAAMEPHPFIVLGDFNRRLNEPGDLVWAELNDGESPNGNLTAVTEHMPISCRNNEFTAFIDHIVTDARASAFVDRSSFRHVTFRLEDRPVWHLISDHCPVVVELWVP
jgi:endonuclease/exonuclease/phosphatase family metal-dependent hydrolase